MTAAARPQPTCAGCTPGTIGHRLLSFPHAGVRASVESLHDAAAGDPHAYRMAVGALHSLAVWRDGDIEATRGNVWSAIEGIVYDASDNSDVETVGLGVPEGPGYGVENALGLWVFRPFFAENIAVHGDDVLVSEWGFTPEMADDLRRGDSHIVTMFTEAYGKVTERTPATRVAEALGELASVSHLPTGSDRPGDPMRTTNVAREMGAWRVTEAMDALAAERHREDPGYRHKIDPQKVKAVLVTAATFADAKRTTFVTVDTLAEVLEMRTRSVDRALSILAAIGAVRRGPRVRDKRGIYTTRTLVFTSPPKGGRR